MKEIKITIKGTEFLLKKTNKAFIDFEIMSGKKISQLEDSYNDVMQLFYCMLKAANRNVFKYTFDEFLDVLDDEDSVQVMEFNDYIQSITTTTEPATPTKKKRK